MACMTHYCTSCSEEWFDNRATGICPKCGSFQVRHTSDETPEYDGPEGKDGEEVDAEVEE